MMHFIQEYVLPCCSSYLIVVSANVLLPGMIGISAASDVTALVNGSGGKCPVPNKARERT